MRRRQLLREGVASTVVGSSIFASSCTSLTDSDELTEGPHSTDAPRSDFFWIHGRLLTDPDIRDNLFAFASRHDLSVVLRVQMPGGGRTATDILREPLAAAREFGLTTWLAAGVFQHITAEQFVTDAEKRQTHRQRLSSLVQEYDELSDGRRVILWEEAPIGGRWAADGKWTEASIQNLRDVGADVFAAQRQTVKDVNPELETGIFVHFTYIVDSKHPQTFAKLMDGLRTRDALPDFSFVDFYRGNYEKDIGPTETNRTVRSLITNVKTHTDDRDVYYLAAAHTIKSNYTVSKHSIDADLRTARAAGVDGIGWYAASNYRQTEQGFDAFVPNTAAEGAIAADDYGTFTVARDRLLYAYTSTLWTNPGYTPGGKFDLWLQGQNLGFHNHRVSARTGDGEWAFLGDIVGYRDGEYEYNTAGRGHVAIFHALDRETFLDADGLDLRLETDAGAGAAELQAAWLVPFDPRAYLAEREATRIVEDRPVSEYTFGQWDGPIALEPGATTAVTIPATGDTSTRSLDSLVPSRPLDLVEQLREREAASDFNPGSVFDLWVLGSNLSTDERPSIDLKLTNKSSYSAERRSVATAAVDDGIIFYGLPRDTFLHPLTERAFEVRRARDAASVSTIYAMPYFGSNDLKTPAEAVDLLREDPEGAQVFSDAKIDYR